MNMLIFGNICIDNELHNSSLCSILEHTIFLGNQTYLDLLGLLVAKLRFINLVHK